MENNKQSSVEWFAEKLKSQGLLIGEPDNLVEQAKEMEKEQIVNAVDAWVTNGSLKGEQYYNETFGGNK